MNPHLTKLHNFIINRRIVQLILWVIILGTIIFYLTTIINNERTSTKNDESQKTSETASNESCNVQGITLHGDLETYIPRQNGESMLDNNDVVSSEDFGYYFTTALQDENIKAIMVEVDSSGGSPVAGEEIADLIKRSNKPVVAYIRQTGVSAAYLAISPADRIFASKNSDVGGIGVTSSYLDYSLQNEQKGIRFIQLSTGKFKDMGNPDKRMTEEEKNLYMRDLKIIHENFVEAVSENRGIAIEQVRAIADGSTVLGERAVELGLIDQIGGYFEVKDYLFEIVGGAVEDCWE